MTARATGSRARSFTWAAVLASMLAACSSPAPVRAPAGVTRRALWDIAPTGASGGVVMRDGAAPRALEMLAGFGELPAGTDRGAEARRKVIAALSTEQGWANAGLDTALGAAAFGSPQKERGLVMVLPVRDRARFRAAFELRAKQEGGREVDEHESGYLCAPAAGRYLCARSLEEIDGAAAPHEAGLSRSVQRLSLDDHGDVEIYGSPRVKEIANLRESAKTLGLLSGVITSIRFRRDGAGVRTHILGDTTTKLAASLAGAPPPPGMSPSAAGAPTVVRAHFDPVAAAAASPSMDHKVRTELAEQLTGDLEIVTSGAGLFGASIVAPLRDAARVERYVKERCADAGGSIRRYALDKITVTAHGCSAVLDPKMLLLPVSIQPVSISISVDGPRLVTLFGDAREPTADRRRWEALVDGDDVRRVLGDAEALVAFTRSPIFGPEVGPAKAFKDMIPFLDEKALSFLDAWGEVGARIYQAVMAVRVAEDGIVAWADFTTFAGDPAEARAAYQTALVRRTAGDEAGYRAALADIEKRFPESRAGKRAAEVRRGGPYLGAGALFLAMLGSIGRRK